MRERSTYVSKLLTDKKSRAAYIKAKLGVIVPSQIRALRMKSDMPRQSDLAKEAGMQQSRISMFETPGAANVTLETLAWLAAIFKVGVIVKFVPFSEMLRWENTFSQDDFAVTKIDDDREFLQPSQAALASKWTALLAGSDISINHTQNNAEVGAATASTKYGQRDMPDIFGIGSCCSFRSWGAAGNPATGQQMGSLQCR